MSLQYTCSFVLCGLSPWRTTSCFTPNGASYMRKKAGEQWLWLSGRSGEELRNLFLYTLICAQWFNPSNYTMKSRGGIISFVSSRNWRNDGARIQTQYRLPYVMITTDSQHILHYVTVKAVGTWHPYNKQEYYTVIVQSNEVKENSSRIVSVLVQAKILPTSVIGHRRGQPHSALPWCLT